MRPKFLVKLALSWRFRPNDYPFGDVATQHVGEAVGQFARLEVGVEKYLGHGRRRQSVQVDLEPGARAHHLAERGGIPRQPLERLTDVLAPA